MKLINLTGQQFGRLTAFARAEDYVSPARWKAARWNCQCSCGATAIVRACDLRNGKQISCGCYKDEQTTARSKTHGASRTRTYKIWTGMRARCERQGYKQFADYGGRGILVCDRWKSFDLFLEDMGECPIGLTIERADNNGNYEPGNCEWIPRKAQSRNRRTTRWIEFNGVRLTTKEWAARVGINKQTLRNRLDRGMSLETALQPIGKTS